MKVLTILVPVYNTEKYIRRCLDSLLVPEVLESIEVLVVNDGSKDRSPEIAQEYADAFQQCDVILTPTSPSPAFRVGERTDDPLKMYAADVCTVTVNIAGLPAISVPCGISENGLPIGMQMIGPKFSEQMLFDVAECYETICGGFGIAPSMKGEGGQTK